MSARVSTHHTCSSCILRQYIYRIFCEVYMKVSFWSLLQDAVSTYTAFLNNHLLRVHFYSHWYSKIVLFKQLQYNTVHYYIPYWTCHILVPYQNTEQQFCCEFFFTWPVVENNCGVEHLLGTVWAVGYILYHHHIIVFHERCSYGMLLSEQKKCPNTGIIVTSIKVWDW